MDILKTSALLTGILMLIVAGAAASPSWSVQEENYAYTMTVTGIVVIDNTESTSEGDTLAAFVGSECRGVTALLASSTLGHSYAYLMIMSNKAGETVHFKVYSRDDDSTINVADSITFVADNSVGTLANPYIFSDEPVSGSYILSLSLDVDGEDVTIDTATSSVSVVVPAGTDVTSLVPAISTSLGSTVTLSNTTLDFSQPVTITVVAQDGSSSSWVITVTSEELSPASDILSLSLGVDNEAVVIYQSPRTVIVTMPAGTDVSALHMNLEVSAGAGASLADTTLDFSQPRSLVVTAEDGSTSQWSIVVIVETATVLDDDPTTGTVFVSSTGYVSCQGFPAGATCKVFCVTGSCIASFATGNGGFLLKHAAHVPLFVVVNSVDNAPLHFSTITW